MSAVVGAANIAKQQAEESAAYQAYQKYKATQQEANVSSGYKYSSDENPEYYGKTAPVKQTAREVLAQRVEQVKEAVKETPTYTYEQRSGGQEKSYEPIVKQGSSIPDITPRQQNAIDFHLEELKRVRFLEGAKKQGVTNIDLYNDKGEKVGSTNPQDVTRASYDILKASIKNGPVKYSYESKSTNYSLSLTEGGIKKPEPQQDNEVASFLKFPFIGQKVSTQTIPSTSYVNVLQFVPLGGNLIEKLYTLPVEAVAKTGAKASTSIINTAVTLTKTQSTISRIEEALHKDNLIIGTEETINPKIVQISQGTISKSGIESFKPENAPVQVYELSSGKVQAVKPILGSKLPETETILTVGRHGEAKPIEVPTTVTLEPGIEGQAQIPITLVETTKKGIFQKEQGNIYLMRSEPQEKIQPNAVLIMFQGVKKEEQIRQAEYYGLKEEKGMKNAYYGELTPELIEKLNYDIKGEAVVTGTDVFKFTKEDFLKNPLAYRAATEEPELFTNKFFIEGENVINPKIIRTIEAKGYTKEDLANLPPRQPETEVKTESNNPLFPQQSMEQIKERYPLMTSHETSDFEQKLEIVKTNPEASNKLSELFTKTETGQENVKTNIPSKRNVMTETDFIFETLQFPPKTDTSNIERLSGFTTQRTDTLSISKRIPANESILSNISDIINKPKQVEKTDTDEIFGLLTNQSTKQTPIQETTPITQQTTKQTTKQVTELVSGGTTPPPTKPKPPIGIPNILSLDNKQEKKKKSKGKNSILFLGNVPQYDIIGMYKREDVIHNSKKIGQLTRKEKSEAGTQGKFITHKSKSIIMKNNKSILTPNKKERKKGLRF